MDRSRCRWCMGDKLMMKYHDEEWGVRQLHDDRALFEFLTLEAMQCGLSWRTVLYKREAMRGVFDNFEPAIIAGYDESKLDELMKVSGIIHSRQKLRSMVTNARRFLAVAEEFGAFDTWLWSFTNGQTMAYPENMLFLATKNELSERLSAELRRRGFKYTGPVVVYSFMQAIGMINDHELGCHFCAFKSKENSEK